MCDNGIFSIHSKNETILYLWLLHKSDNQKNIKQILKEFKWVSETGKYQLFFPVCGEGPSICLYIGRPEVCARCIPQSPSTLLYLKQNLSVNLVPTDWARLAGPVSPGIPRLYFPSCWRTGTRLCTWLSYRTDAPNQVLVLVWEALWQLSHTVLASNINFLRPCASWANRHIQAWMCTPAWNCSPTMKWNWMPVRWKYSCMLHLHYGIIAKLPYASFCVLWSICFNWQLGFEGFG